MELPSIKRSWLAAGLGTVLAALLLITQFAGVFDQLEESLLDWRQSLPAPRPAKDYHNQLGLIAIDYIPADRPWPWPRLDYVILLRSLLPYAPKSIVFETLLHNRDTRYGAFDSTFGALVNRLDHVIFAAAVLTPTAKEPAPANLVPITTRGDTSNMPRFGSSLWPLDAFAASATVGVSNLMPETNGQVRRVPLLFLYQNRVIPSLTLQAVAQSLNASWAKSEAIMGDSITLRSENGDILRVIPIDTEGRFRLRMRRDAAPFWTASFGNVPLFAQQRERGETPEMDLIDVRGRQLWVGRTDHKDLTPLNSTQPHLSAIELQMLATENILNADYIHRAPGWCLVLFYLSFSIVGAAFYLKHGWIPGAVFSFIIVWVWWEASFLLFRAANIDLPLLSLTILGLGLAAVAYAAQEWDLKPDEGNQLSLKLK